MPVVLHILWAISNFLSSNGAGVGVLVGSGTGECAERNNADISRMRVNILVFGLRLGLVLVGN